MVSFLIIVAILVALGLYLSRQFIINERRRSQRRLSTAGLIRRNFIAILVAVSLIMLVAFYRDKPKNYIETTLAEYPELPAGQADSLMQNVSTKPEKTAVNRADTVILTKEVTEETKLPEEKELSEQNELPVKEAEELTKSGNSTNFFPNHKGITFGPRRKEKLVFMEINADSLEATLNAAINKNGNSKTKAIIQYYLTTEWLDRSSNYLSKARGKFTKDVNNGYFDALVDSVKTQSYLAKPRPKYRN